jgi:aspartate 1-decarboxylase
MGSVTIDAALMERAGLKEYEQVHVVDIDNGARLVTYVIKGEAGSGVICLNGAAARLAQVGDKVIIMSYVGLTPDEVSEHKPIIVFLDENNNATSIDASSGGSPSDDVP